jgi:DNA-binding transcriptional ArsR family regulator
MAYEAALAALADPTRREVFEQLRAGPRAVGEIAGDMPVSRPAVSQHLKVLKLAGLVADRAEGTRRVYYIDPNGLGALRKWLDQFWDQALAAFQAEVGRSSEPPPAATTREKTHEPHDHDRARTQKRARRRRSRTRF